MVIHLYLANTTSTTTTTPIQQTPGLSFSDFIPQFGFPGLDWVTMSIILAGLGLGFLLGMVVGTLMAKRSPLLRKLNLSKYVAIVYDVDQDRWDIVPIKPLGHQVFYSLDSQNPSVIVKPADTNFRLISSLNKMGILAVSKKTHGFAVNPQSLMNIGVAGIALGDKVPLNAGEPGLMNTLETVNKLLEYQGKITGKIMVNPELKLAIALDVPKTLRSVIDFLASISLASLTGLKDNILSVERFVNVMNRMAGMGQGSWMRWVIALIAVIGGLLLVWSIVGG